MSRFASNRIGFNAALLLLLLASSPVLIGEENKADNKALQKEQTEDDAEAKIAPRLEEALINFIRTLAPTHSKRAKETIQEAIDETVEATGLKKEISKLLDEAGKRAVIEVEAAWQEKAMASMRKMYGKRLFDDDVIDSLVESMDEAIAATGMLPDNYRITPDISPVETEAWKSALQTHLSDEQRASLILSDEQKDKLARKKYQALVKQSAERYRQHFSTGIQREVADLKSALELGDERSDKLDASATETIDNSLKELETIQMAAVLKASPSSRKSYLQRGYISSSISAVTQPHESKMWQSSLEDLLSEQERNNYKSFSSARRERAIEAGANLLTTALDDLLYFSSEQRTKVSKLLRDPAEEKTYRSLTEPNHSLSINLQQAVQYGKDIDKKKFNAILVGWQRKFWEEHADKLAKGNQSTIKEKKKGKIEKQAEPAISPPGLESRMVEAAIIDQIFSRSPYQFALVRSQYDGMLEAVHLTAKLSDQQRTKLEIAAKGAATLQHKKWVEQLESYLRQQVNGQQPDVAVKRLKALTNVSLGRSTEPRARELWDATIEDILSAPQREVLQKHIDDRLAFRWTTLAAINTQLLDVHARMRPSIAEQLQQQLAEAFTKYGKDIDAVFNSWSRDNPWYLNSYYNLIGLHAIPEETLTETIGKPAYKIWKEKLHSRGRSYWPRVEESYDKRQKDEAKKKDTKPAEQEQD